MLLFGRWAPHGALPLMLAGAVALLGYVAADWYYGPPDLPVEGFRDGKDRARTWGP